MDLGIEGKVAFIGGSSDGLGKSVAFVLAAEGAHVIINGRHAEKLEGARHELESRGYEVSAICADLSDATQRLTVIDEVNEAFGGVDILITNTGGPPSGRFEDLEQEAWDEAYGLLLASAVQLIRAFLPRMKANKWGRIVTITSQAVKQPVDNLILSNAIRTSVVGLVKSLSNELGTYGITVNNAMPGFTKTTRLEQLIESHPEFVKAVDDIPLRRFAEPSEFAAAVAFLASDQASYITGVSLAVDGGWIKSLL